MGIVETFISFLEQLAENVPVELFAFLGSFIEELIAPIPSPVVMTLAGTMVKSNGSPFWYLFVVAVIASLGVPWKRFPIFSTCLCDTPM